MRRIKTGRFVVRFWFKLPTSPTELDRRTQTLIGFINRLEKLNKATCEDVVELVEAFFDEHDGIAAFEVLSAATHNGLVSYYDWP